MLSTGDNFVQFFAFSCYSVVLCVDASYIRFARSPDDTVTVKVKIMLNGSRSGGSGDGGGRIVNGTFVFPRQYPFLVAILDVTGPSNWNPQIILPWEKPAVITGPYCSGTLVSLQHVLTACHCVLDLRYPGRSNSLKLRQPRSIMTIAGREDIDPFSKGKKPPLAYNFPKTLHHHPKCYVTFGKTVWDVGMMALEVAYKQEAGSIVPLRVFDFERIFPLGGGVRVTSREWFEKQGEQEAVCVATGFGVKLDKDRYLAFQAAVKLQSSRNCSIKLSEATAHLIDGALEFHNDSQICTISSGTPCDGDSGGPLLCDVPDTELRPRLKRVQIGVISHGTVCGNISVPVLYTRIDIMTTWIADIIKSTASEYAKSSTAICCTNLFFLSISLLIRMMLIQ